MGVRNRLRILRRDKPLPRPGFEPRFPGLIVPYSVPSGIEKLLSELRISTVQHGVPNRKCTVCHRAKIPNLTHLLRLSMLTVCCCCDDDLLITDCTDVC